MSPPPNFRPRGGAAGGSGQFYQGPPNFNFPNQGQAFPFFQNPNFLHPQQFHGFQARPSPPSPNELVVKVDRAAVKARRDLVAAKHTVTAWKVSEAVLLALQVDSWSTLGLKMQQVPALNHLMSLEGKINAFIHCFVGVSRITTLHDLEVAICENEGIEHFEDLELGPLVRHQLVVHYFSVNHGTTEVYKITTEEVISCLSEIMDVRTRKDIINTEDLLDFIAKKFSVAGRDSIGVRVQGLGWHIFCIGKAKRVEKDNVKKCMSTLKPSPNERITRHTERKEQLDDRFCAISQRFKSFSSVHGQFSGKHIKFVSSSSGEEDSDDSVHETAKNEKDANSHFKTPQDMRSHDKTSNCPYPSAIEEITRLGLKGDATCSPNCSEDEELSQSKTPRGTFQKKRVKGDVKAATTSGSSKFSESNRSVRKKRRSEKASGSLTVPQKKLKRDKVGGRSLKLCDQNNEFNSNEIGLPLDTDSTKMFVTTWKDACREHTAVEVFERMLDFYKTTDRQRKRMKSMLSSYPLAGLLNVAVASIKGGLWDNIYDALHAVSGDEINNSNSENNPEFEIIDVKGSEKNAPAVGTDIVERECSVKDVIDKVASYFELDPQIHSSRRSPIENKLIGCRKLYNCESWVAEKLCVKEFKSLGHGDFIMFLEQHLPLLPNALQKILNGDECKKCPLDVCLLEQIVVELVSQASNTLSGNETVTEQMIYTLLSRQFPLLSFKLRENGSLEEFLDIVRKQKNNVISNCVVFSAPLSESCFNKDSSDYDESNISEVTEIRTDSDSQAIPSKSVTTKDAIEALCKAPMLSDLKAWSHWDAMFAPSLGPMVAWLGNEVRKEDLWCLLTEDGKVIRINPIATVNSFWEAAVKGSSFETAVELLSIYCSVGGERHVPFSLLKSHARRAFEVIVKNCLDAVEANESQNIRTHGNKQQICGEVSSSGLGSRLANLSKLDKAVPVASKFFLDCLYHFPSYHRRFAAAVLLSGLQSVIKDAYSAILCECKQLEQRIMLHDVGMALGIVEWINDFHVFSCTSTIDSFVFSEASCLKASGSDLESGNMQDMPVRFPSSEEKIIGSVKADSSNYAEISTEMICDGCTPVLSEHGESTDATLVIESIRREEFGLDSTLPGMESSMLSKQHARLGRALHCLSQELYSQDSHFLLELVQNADDNMYPKNVEPMLSFILLEEGIIILNNERGFSSQNIRALCDVGNSTKKGSGAGYIGQKGIGFKSVFRVTDAPEIHSNGFHVKFDISEGEIGFVLPTLVPPCNIDLYSRLASAGCDPTINNHWNTCIVLPFRTKLSEENAVNSILTMFSDLDTSLLLFLHRLQCIKFRDMVNGSLIVMRKEIVGDGIIRISGGKKKMTCFVVSQKVNVDSIHRGVKTTEISIAFTLQESDDGIYSPLLDQQPVFAFLPLRKYGLKFILQGDFVLPSSREEVDGNSLWNQHLLSVFPCLFVSAQASFCALPCYRENPGKAITAYMSFVPLCGEVQGFFTNLPRFIISELRESDCLLLEGDSNRWVRPPKVLRGWSEQARSLLPENLLLKHLGLVGFLQKDIVLSDLLALALGIKEYGPKTLVDFMYSVCSNKEDGPNSLGLGWISSWLNELHALSIQSDQISRLRGIPFIPLSDGTYSSISQGRIWIRSDGTGTSFDGEDGPELFPNIYAELRTVNPALFTVSSVNPHSSESTTSVDNLIGLLRRIGVQQLSAHDITMVHILPALTSDKMTGKDKKLMIEYLCFAMVHLHSTCPVCHVEREFILSELRNKVFILTNHGFKRPIDVPIHFNKEFGNPVDMNRLVNVVGMEWHEVDTSYLKHPSTKSLSSALPNWRKFLQEIGVSDFVKIAQVDNVADIAHAPESLAKDWKSEELVKLLSLSTYSGNRDSCKYLLEVVDTLWDDHFRDKVAGYGSSVSVGSSKALLPSCVSCFCDFKWVVSSTDGELHFPRDLFYDCDAVRSIIGASAPYAVPKVKNEKLVDAFGFKTRVSLDDLVEIFKVWRSQISFKASVSQMSRLYAFISSEITVSERNIVQELCSEPFIFVPCVSGFGSEDVVTGIFYSPKDVYWHDSSGSVDLLKESDPQDQCPLNNTLCNVYPGLHHFFVNTCGVSEVPPFDSYLQILQQLSATALPSQAAKSVFQIFLKWTEGLNSGLLGPEDIVCLKECLRKLEFTVLPTRLDKWVSLHSSFGLVCWCDNEKLKKEFKNSENIDFLYFGVLSCDETEMLQTKVSVLMQQLGIPSLSEAVTRKAIPYGLSNSYLKASLVNWALPYAQRYMFGLHTDKYTQLKQSGFDKVYSLRVLVVDKLYYSNVIKSYSCVSKKRCECDCLLEDTVLYSTQEADSHAIFMELSRLLFGGIPELHLANFLHLITTMAKSGSSEEETEQFILTSQKLPKLPDEESVWSLSLPENDSTEEESSAPTVSNESLPSTFTRKAGQQNWPPADWKTAPGFSFARANGYKTQPAIQPSSSGQTRNDDDDFGETVIKMNWAAEDFSTPGMASFCLPDSNNMMIDQPDQASDWHTSMDITCHPIVSIGTVSDGPESNKFNFSKRDRLSFNTPNSTQALITGRQGEHVAFKYFSGKYGDIVKWVNEDSETGLPYDIVIMDNKDNTIKEYIEVKATTSARKDWFNITKREWQFAVENGESFSIAHVILSDNNVAKVSVFKNPAKLCQQGLLQLVVMMPRQLQPNC